MSDAVTSTILIVGSANMDLVVTTDRFPKPGETVLAGDFGMYAGGKGANQAVACARVGGDVILLAKMGCDVFRDRLFESLEHDGVDVSSVLVDDRAPTGIALITVDSEGQNEIVVVSGANMELSVEDVEAGHFLFDRAEWVVLQLEIPLPTVVHVARTAAECGAHVVLNPAPATDLPDELLRYVDVLTPNESEIEMLTGMTVGNERSAVAAAGRLVERGVDHVILTLGSRGAMHVTANDVQVYPAFDVESIDTTAAGDAFTGALVAALSRGEDFLTAIPFANAVAACCVGKMGAQASMPTSEEVRSFLDRMPTPEVQR